MNTKSESSRWNKKYASHYTRSRNSVFIVFESVKTVPNDHENAWIVFNYIPVWYFCFYLHTGDETVGLSFLAQLIVRDFLRGDCPRIRTRAPAIRSR